MSNNNLFRGLPPPKVASRARVEHDLEAVPKRLKPDSPQLPAAQPATANLPPAERTAVDGSRVDCGASTPSIDVSVAIGKISAHVDQKSKFAKASKLALQLLDGGHVAGDHVLPFFGILEKAMASPSVASEPKLLRELSELVAKTCALSPMLDRRRQAWLEAWRVAAVIRREMHTDDSYQFARAVGEVKKALHRLPPVTPEEIRFAEQHDAQGAATTSGPARAGPANEPSMGPEAIPVPASTAATANPSDADASVAEHEAQPGPARDESVGGAAAASSTHPLAPPVPGGQDASMNDAAGGTLGGRGQGPPDQGDLHGQQAPSADVDAAPGPSGGTPAPAVEKELDPFGLDELLAPVPLPPPPPPKPVVTAADKERRRRDKEERATREARDALRLRLEQRRSVLACLVDAHGCYKHAWARAAVDLLLKEAHDALDLFLPTQKTEVERIWLSVKDSQVRRRLGGGGDAKEMTSFERSAAKWAGEKMSIRKAVGASSTDARPVNWLG